MDTISPNNDIYNIYLENYEHINKSFKQKSRAYGTLFERKMINLWLCDGELMTNKTNINIHKHFNECERWQFSDMEFIYQDGFLVSNYLFELGCKNYKFECKTQ